MFLHRWQTISLYERSCDFWDTSKEGIPPTPTPTPSIQTHHVDTTSFSDYKTGKPLPTIDKSTLMATHFDEGPAAKSAKLDPEANKIGLPVEPSAPPQELIWRWEATLRETETVDYWTVLPFPYEINHKILNMVGFQRARQRLQRGWKLLHHALQPCSVCGNLLAVKTEERGEIRSSGELWPWSLPVSFDEYEKNFHEQCYYYYSVH